MRIAVKANTDQKQAFLAKGVPSDVLVTWLSDEKDIPEADAYFDLLFEEGGAAFPGITGKPVFISSVIKTCKDLPENYIRLNAWNGFLERDIIETAATDPQTIAWSDAVLKRLGWKYQPAPDIPGMIAARVIAMIVNEAYFGLGDEISSKAEIDTAMKLGTNYPLGPFEWSQKIGLSKIYALLKKLSSQDSRYAVAPSLEKELTTQSDT